jgi:hypothetical protein
MKEISIEWERTWRRRGSGKKLGESRIAMNVFKGGGKGGEKSARGLAIFRAWRAAGAVYRDRETISQQLGQQSAGKLLVDCCQRAGICCQRAHCL